MDLRIDAANAVPIYAQVVEQIKALVATRALRAGDAVPSVRELASTLRINRNTAAKAYQILEAEGVLETRAGQGTFVGHEGPRWSRQERMSRLERSLDRSLVEAYHLEIPFDEVPAVLDRRIGNFGGRGSDQGSDPENKGD
jgi:GntR family transcriptional regulator